MSRNKIKILYIGGAGRSGSTLLEMILGNNDNFFSIGEARFFWEYADYGDVLCGCGEILHDCDFWGKVIKGLSRFGISISKVATLNRKLNRTRNSLFVNNQMLGNGTDFKFLTNNIAMLYRLIDCNASKPILVDSSKVPSHLAFLKKIDEIDLKILHLVRDGRAVVYSWTKRRKKEIAFVDKSATMPKYSTFRSLLGWMVENILIEYFCKDLVYTRMRYEDFVIDPVKQLRNALDNLGLMEYAINVRLEEMDIKPTHSVGGNPIRFNASNYMKISLDKEWQEKMGLQMKHGLWLIAAPIMTHYGYKLSGEE